MSGQRGVHELGLGQDQAERGQACGQRGAVEELPVPGAGRPVFSGAAGFWDRDKAGERPDVPAECPVFTLQDWTCCLLHTQVPTWLYSEEDRPRVPPH